MKIPLVEMGSGDPSDGDRASGPLGRPRVEKENSQEAMNVSLLPVFQDQHSST
jgi:hypothetical protein